jgi:hypothetical protein
VQDIESSGEGRKRSWWDVEPHGRFRDNRVQGEADVGLGARVAA